MWTLRRLPTSLTLSQPGDEVLSFDLEGRLLTWFRQGTLYKRSLGSQVLARRRDGGQRQRWALDEAQTRTFFAELWARLEDVRPLVGGLALDLPLRWTPERLLAERERYAAAYAPVSILPPDQYLAVVVQATRGCSWNRCTFCTFYRDRAFAVQTPQAFATHLTAVGELLGRGAALRRSIFLGDGNALLLAQSRLLPLIGQARAAFPGRDVYGFLDVFSGSRKSPDEWAALRRAGVRRVYLGLESGHDPLLAWLNKPGDAATSLSLIRDLKAAGLQVAPIFMTGVGGKHYAAAHLQDTLKLLRELPLDAGDLVYLSPFVPHGEYAERAAARGIAALSESEIGAQEETLRQAARSWHPAVKVARYDIREFLY